MPKTAFEAPRFSGFWLPPESLVIVDDPKDPLYDARGRLPPGEPLIRNIAAEGIHEPVLICRRGDKAIVVDGRQRVRAAVEANKRLSAKGCELVAVPCMLKTGEDAALFGILCTSNEHRLNDTPLEKAKKATKLKALGRSDAQIAITFGVSESAVKKWLKMLDLPTAIRKEIEAGHISADAALKLRDEDPDKAVAAVQSAVASAAAAEAVADEVEKDGRKQRRKSPKRSQRAVAKVLQGQSDVKAPRMKSRKQVEERLATPHIHPDAANELKWVLGWLD